MPSSTKTWRQIQEIANKSELTLTSAVTCGSCGVQEVVTRPVVKSDNIAEWKRCDDMDLTLSDITDSLYDLGWRHCHLGPDFELSQEFGSDHSAPCCPDCIAKKLVEPVNHA